MFYSAILPNFNPQHPPPPLYNPEGETSQQHLRIENFNLSTILNMDYFIRTPPPSLIVKSLDFLKNPPPAPSKMPNGDLTTNSMSFDKPPLKMSDNNSDVDDMNSQKVNELFSNKPLKVENVCLKIDKIFKRYTKLTMKEKKAFKKKVIKYDNDLKKEEQPETPPPLQIDESFDDGMDHLVASIL